MPKVDPTALEAVIKSAGLDRGSANALRAANNPKEDKPRGHGAASQNLSPMGDL